MEIEKTHNIENKSQSALYFLDHWDITRYIQIAKDGYTKEFNALEYNNIGFFPLNSAIIVGITKLVSLVTFKNLSDSYTALHVVGLIVSNLFAYFSGILLYLISRKYFEDRSAMYIALSIFLIPSSFYLSLPYAESLLLLLSLLSFYFAEKDEWHYAILFALGATLTKSMAVLIVIPLIIIAILSKQNVSRKVLYSLLPLFGTILYGVFTYYITGDLLAYIHVQNGAWQHHWTEPISFLVSSMFIDTSNMLSALYCILCIVSIIIFWKKIPMQYSVYSIIFMLFTPLTGYTVGLIRYSVSAVALYFIIGYMLENTKNRVRYSTVVYALIFVQAIFVSLWLRDFWMLS